MVQNTWDFSKINVSKLLQKFFLSIFIPTDHFSIDKEDLSYLKNKITAAAKEKPPQKVYMAGIFIDEKRLVEMIICEKKNSSIDCI